MGEKDLTKHSLHSAAIKDEDSVRRLAKYLKLSLSEDMPIREVINLIFIALRK